MRETQLFPGARHWRGWPLALASLVAAALALSLAGPAGAQGLSVKGGEAGAGGLGAGGVGTRASGSSLYGLSSPGGPSLGISSPDVAASGAGQAPARAGQASAPSPAGQSSPGRGDAPGKRAASKAKP